VRASAESPIDYVLVFAQIILGLLNITSVGVFMGFLKKVKDKTEESVKKVGEGGAKLGKQGLKETKKVAKKGAKATKKTAKKAKEKIT
jgi:hypothetical protein